MWVLLNPLCEVVGGLGAREGAAVIVSVGHTLRSDAIKGGQCSLILAHPQCNRLGAQSPPQCPLLLQTPGPPRCTAISQTQTKPTLSTRERAVELNDLNGGGVDLRWSFKRGRTRLAVLD